MFRRVVLALACVLALPVLSAQAHFIWLDLVKTSADADAGQVRVYFSETPGPGMSPI